MKNANVPLFTIYAHVFYPDVWAEMITELEDRISDPFNLIITRPQNSAPVIRPNSPMLCSVVEIEVENRGRDILPFLRALRDQLLPATDIGLKLHTKKSLHRSDGDEWRRFMTDSLLTRGTSKHLTGYEFLINEPCLGLITPGAHLLPLQGRISRNENTILQVLERLNKAADLGEIEAGRYSSGSMFWFRRAALQSLLDSDFRDLFPEENGQLDGTTAHALERLFAFLVEQQGYVAASMESAKPVGNFSGSHPLSREDLTALVDDTLLMRNPFSLPLGSFLRSNKFLLRYAHAIYNVLPNRVVRLVRRTIS